MTLDQYFSGHPGAPSVAAFAAMLAAATGGKVAEAAVRQWRHQYVASGTNTPRRPSPENCVAIEKMTGGLVTRRDLRPDDWHRIWPELSVPEPAKPKKAKRAAERATATDVPHLIQRDVDFLQRITPPADKPNNKREGR